MTITLLAIGCLTLTGVIVSAFVAFVRREIAKTEGVIAAIERLRCSVGDLPPTAFVHGVLAEDLRRVLDALDD